MRILFEHARIVDGTGARERRGDVLVEDDTIAEVGETSLAPDEVVDCSGMVLAPGFIDMHSHSDFTLPGRPLADAKVLQGVTTEVVGNCGIGLLPANERVERMYEKLTPLFLGERGSAVSRSLAEYRERLHARGISVNAACLLPHGNVRCAAMGMEERPATASELEHMRDLVRAGMEEGAFGMSTGLVYPPGAYADDDEIVEVAKELAPFDGLYASHMRDEGGRLLHSIAETIAIGEKAGVKVQISHHKAVGRFNYGKVKKSLALVEEARARGLDVTSDVYPYTAGSTILAAMFLPLWAFEGSPDETIARMKDPATRKRIERDSKERMKKLIRLPGLLDKIVPKGLLVPAVVRELEKLIVVSSVKHQHDFEGMTLEQIRKKRGRALYDALLDLLVEEETAVAAIAHVMDEDDVRTVMAHPTTMIGTDGFNQREGKPHPRTYGTYPRILEHYVRGLGLLSLETAIHKMTGMVADKLGLDDRGVIAKGMRADIVVFDPAAVRDRATYESPRNPPEGIPHVFVNGAWTVKDGEHTQARAGRVLAHR